LQLPSPHISNPKKIKQWRNEWILNGAILHLIQTNHYKIIQPRVFVNGLRDLYPPSPKTLNMQASQDL
jgi:hypothetical protein